ncbi:glycine betaine/L-proline transporter ProP [Streptomyces sp. NPDC012438]|uniref:glycine betaine/L-proline transporter ProP n=1 Tax=Streptomyces sp. NPDC012438 TaxID=3364833 RepID=UPI0036E13624
MPATDNGPAADPEALRRHPRLFRAVSRRKQPRLRRTDITVTDEAAVRRAVKAAALGNAMEWFDFGIYAYLAVTLGHVFFPSGNDTVQLMSSFATFAVAFLVRPLGGMFFGPMGDRLGRKKVLALTMILMAVGTFAIGLIPSYASIGFWAPVLLIAFRMLQGFSTGGEYGGASTFIAEYAPDQRRGYFGSFLEFGTLAGYVGAAGLVTALTAWLGSDTMEAWGWRVPFLVAGPLGLVGLYLRMRLDETPAFQRLESDAAHPSEAADAVETTTKGDLAKIFRQQWPMLLLCVALVGAYNITDYMVLSYMPTYLSDELGYSETHGLLILLLVMVLLMLVITRVGKLNDRFGRKPVLMAGMLGFLFLSLPAFLLIGQGGIPAITAGMLMLGLSLVCMLGTMSAALPALFPTDVRYGSLSVGYNLSTSLFGGTTPLVITALIGATGSNLMPAYYAMGAALVGVIAVACMKETARQPLEGSPPSVETHEEAAEMVMARAPEPKF